MVPLLNHGSRSIACLIFTVPLCSSCAFHDCLVFFSLFCAFCTCLLRLQLSAGMHFVRCVCQNQSYELEEAERAAAAEQERLAEQARKNTKNTSTVTEPPAKKRYVPDAEDVADLVGSFGYPGTKNNWGGGHGSAMLRGC
jgi:hypothetical protein